MTEPTDSPRQSFRHVNLAFAISLVLLALTGVASVRSTLAYQTLAHERAQTRRVLVAAKELTRAVLHVQAREREYLLSGEDVDRQEYFAARGRLEPALADIERLAGAEESVRSAVSEERALLQAGLVEMDRIVELRRQGGAAVQAELQRMREGGTDRLLDVAAAHERQIEARLDERVAEADRLGRRTTAAIVVAIGASIAVLVVAFAWLRREIARRARAAARLHVLNQELREATGRAQEADRLKSAFLATMSHELRTPLNSILGFTGILLQGLAGPLNEEQDKQLRMVQGSARHLLALINDVLDLSKIEAGELRVAREPFDLRASIARVIATVEPLATKKGLTLTARVAPEVGTVRSDPRRVEQVLLNLLNNAIKFTERGEVSLAAEVVTDGHALAAGAPVVRVRVSDTGMGIKPEDLATLFRPFSQVESGTSRHHEGTGLGLAICRRLADLLGGTIGADSRWQQGSVFTFTLPVGETVTT